MKLVTSNKNEGISAYRNEAFDNGFYQYFKNKDKNKISETLNCKERNIKFKSVTYRQLNSWEAEGLLTIEREGSEWRKFSIIDAIWVKMIKELREFGMSRKQLKVAKESLEFESKKCGVVMPMLEFYTAFAIGAKMPVLIMIFKDGLTIPCSLVQYKVAKEFVGVENHIQLSLNDLLQGMLPDVDLSPYILPESALTIDEVELLAFMRLGKFENVEVKYKDGKIDIIEGTERIATNKIAEIMKEQAYDEIKIRRQGGAITSVVRIKKKKL